MWIWDNGGVNSEVRMQNVECRMGGARNVERGIRCAKGCAASYCSCPKRVPKNNESYDNFANLTSILNIRQSKDRMDSLAPARLGLAGLLLRAHSFRQWAPSLPFSRPLAFASQILFVTSQVAQIPSGSSHTICSVKICHSMEQKTPISQLSQSKFAARRPLFSRQRALRRAQSSFLFLRTDHD